MFWMPGQRNPCQGRWPGILPSGQTRASSRGTGVVPADPRGLAVAARRRELLGQ